MDFVGMVFAACGSLDSMRGVETQATSGLDNVRFVPIPDRRRTPDRRALWRGGRRSTDRVERGETVVESDPLTQPLTRIWRWLSSWMV